MSFKIYDIADLRVKMNCRKGRTEKQAKAYLSKNQSEKDPDITIDISPQRIERSMKEHPELNSDDWEYMLSGSDFYNSLIDFGGMLLHSSCVVLDGTAYAFTADSGVGKSTHTQLWLNHFGSRAYILNDDKPAIRIIDKKVYAYGTPWSGKYDYSVPKKVPLGGICFVERGKTNEIEKADTSKAVYGIFSQTIRRLPRGKMEKLLVTLNAVFKNVPLWHLKCTISDEAVEVSSKAMTGKNYD